jgi:outer membrane protein OmpA-like peptidoglycan-associated protein
VQYKYQQKASLSRLITIPVERVTHQEKRLGKRADIRKNRYNLILFDVGSDKVSGVHERIVTAIRATNVFSSSASVRVFGYTDMVGADDLNQTLSQRRAESVAQTLGLTPQSVQTLMIKGRGEEPPLLYDNDTPEGRFYCRAVIIELDSPILYE